MRKTISAIVMLTVGALSTLAATSYNQNITAIFGSGNPDTGWTVDTSNNIELGLRAKNRANGDTSNVMGVYTYATAPATRGEWNYEFSINSDVVNGTDPLTTYDYYLAADGDPSQCIEYTTVSPLTYWSDNSFGNDSTPNGGGIEGPAVPLATTNNIAQNSQNITFGDYPGGAQMLQPNATYTYELYAVPAGAGPNGTRLASVSITVVVGSGGAPCPDVDNDGVPDNVDQCVPSDLRPFVDTGSGPTTIPNTVDSFGCSRQDYVNGCADVAANHGQYVTCVRGLLQSWDITNAQRQEGLTGASKSDIGK